MTTYECSFANGPLGLSIEASGSHGVIVSDPTVNVPLMSAGDKIIRVNGVELPDGFSPSQFALLIEALREKREGVTLELRKHGEKDMGDVMSPFIKSSLHVAVAKLIRTGEWNRGGRGR